MRHLSKPPMRLLTAVISKQPMALHLYFTQIIGGFVETRQPNSSQSNEITTPAHQPPTKSTPRPPNVRNPHPPLSLLRPHLVSETAQTQPNIYTQETANLTPRQDRTLPPLQASPQPLNMPRLLRVATSRPSKHSPLPQPPVLHFTKGLSALRRLRA
jgi:hypothetical protein